MKTERRGQVWRVFQGEQADNVGAAAIQFESSGLAARNGGYAAAAAASIRPCPAGSCEGRPRLRARPVHAMPRRGPGQSHLPSTVFKQPGAEVRQQQDGYAVRGAQVEDVADGT